MLGHRALLPGQLEAVRAAVSGRDTLVLLPTGGGKSAVYQLVGLERPGPSVVVCPLVALQQDQLDGLEELRLPAAALNSTLSEAEHAQTLRRFGNGEIEFLLLAPEQLANPDVLDALAAAKPSLLVVDEAHCVSEWGHDFRPEYRRLGQVREVLGRPPVLALTGTASPPVREDVIRWLRLDDPVVVARGFDRPELFLSVSHHSDAASKRQALLEWLDEAERPGIVYVATRRAASDIARALVDRGVSTEAYHAGLGAARRERVLGDFIGDRIEVVVATIAFGMGVDKPNVRFVAHHDASESLDAYHQEIGRAGRDGEAARAHLFFDPADLGLRRFQSIPPALASEHVAAVIEALSAGGMTVDRLARRTGFSGRRVEQLLGRLEEVDEIRMTTDGVAELTESERAADANGKPNGKPVRARAGEVAASVVEAQERRRQQARSRVELVRGYAETRGCRRRYLLNSLGEEFEAPCHRCDNCEAGAADAEVDGGQRMFELNELVNHAVFGPGQVSRVESDRVSVRFEKTGYRTLALPDAVEAGVLRRASPERR